MDERPKRGIAHSHNVAVADMRAHPFDTWSETHHSDPEPMIYRWNGTALEWEHDGKWHRDNNDWTRANDGDWRRL